MKYSDFSKWKEYLYHTPTPAGMCTAFNPPPYSGIKKLVGIETLIDEVFNLKKTVGHW